jgi:putative mRNA 3-end processing factor
LARIDRGIRFGDHFAVDPTRKAELAVVSHAHSDHFRAHRRILATGPTLDLGRLRHKRFQGSPVEYHENFKLGPATVELAPAGHMLGSAQVIIDWHSERIVYTGDFKLDENHTCRKAEIHTCDTLLIDTTYGHPHYRFPSAAECRERLLEFVAASIKSGILPVILAYSLGKAQETMKMLSDDGIEMEVYKTAHEAALVYKKYGIEMEGIHLLDGRPRRDRAVIIPPGGFRFVDYRGWGKFRTCFLSGWALDRRYGSRGGSSIGIPFSDHASFDDIVRYVETARPKRVYTLFGPPDIAEYLNRIGFKAQCADLNEVLPLSRKGNVNGDLFS